ncbi:hypothetical protein FGO68_gene6805 [Halteria grandinella]|uniref:Transmembrane protein n=1 Tax=Halteria grandinella TaxID=5974 RepID=A0A8J8NL00_HALGN|nr:hypothetical protein FGO68_gene6805 [Halteria grandinella]
MFYACQFIGLLLINILFHNLSCCYLIKWLAVYELILNWKLSSIFLKGKVHDCHQVKFQDEVRIWRIFKNSFLIYLYQFSLILLEKVDIVKRNEIIIAFEVDIHLKNLKALRLYILLLNVSLYLQRILVNQVLTLSIYQAFPSSFQFPLIFRRIYTQLSISLC